MKKIINGILACSIFTMAAMAVMPNCMAADKAADTKVEATTPIVIEADQLDKIAENADKVISVHGTIEAIKYSDKGKLYFLNFNKDYKKSMTVIIKDSVLPEFKKVKIEKIEDFYQGKEVVITGKVIMFKSKPEDAGKPEIDVETPDQIVIKK